MTMSDGRRLGILQQLSACFARFVGQPFQQISEWCDIFWEIISVQAVVFSQGVVLDSLHLCVVLIGGSRPEFPELVAERSNLRSSKIQRFARGLEVLARCLRWKPLERMVPYGRWQSWRRSRGRSCRSACFRTLDLQSQYCSWLNQWSWGRHGVCSESGWNCVGLSWDEFCHGFFSSSDYVPVESEFWHCIWFSS